MPQLCSALLSAEPPTSPTLHSRLQHDTRVCVDAGGLEEQSQGISLPFPSILYGAGGMTASASARQHLRTRAQAPIRVHGTCHRNSLANESAKMELSVCLAPPAPTWAVLYSRLAKSEG